MATDGKRPPADLLVLANRCRAHAGFDSVPAATRDLLNDVAVTLAQAHRAVQSLPVMVEVHRTDAVVGTMFHVARIVGDEAEKLNATSAKSAKTALEEVSASLAMAGRNMLDEIKSDHKADDLPFVPEVKRKLEVVH